MGANGRILALGVLVLVLGAALFTQKELIREKVLGGINELLDRLQSIMDESGGASGMGGSPTLTILENVHDTIEKLLERSTQIMAGGGVLIVISFFVGGGPSPEPVKGTGGGGSSFTAEPGERVIKRIDLPDRTYIITDQRIIFRPADEEVHIKDIERLHTTFNIRSGAGSIQVTDILGDVRTMGKLDDVRAVNNILANLMETKLETGSSVTRGDKDTLF